MVIHGTDQDYSIIYRKQIEQDMEILIGKAEAEDRYVTLLRFYQKEDIQWLLGQNLLAQGISGNFEDYRGSFLWQDCLFLVFTRREGMALSEWLDREKPDLSRRLEAGRHLLERLLLLNMPEYLLSSILNEDCILVIGEQKVIIRYEPEEWVGRNPEPEKQLKQLFYRIFLRLFQAEASPQIYKEIYDFLEQLKQEPYQDIFHIYQCYDRLQDCMAGRENSLYRSFGWKERWNRLGEGLKHTGERLLAPILLAVGMAVLIYGICHPGQEEAEEFLFEQIGTLEIRK